jgi:hypothetical protein
MLQLSKLRLVVIDNSVRESTVGQPKGHTLADKHRFTHLVQASGIRHQLIAVFSAKQRRVDDQFCLDLQADPTRYDGQVFYCFSEVAGELREPGHEPDLDPPAALLRAKEYGLRNVFLELDGVCKTLYSVEVATKVLGARIVWIREHLSKDARIYVNLRDLPITWDMPASTLRGVARWLATLPREQRITGLVFEDYNGSMLPALFSAMTAELRAVMAQHDWDGDLLVHVHNGFGLAEACVMGALGSGANGIWCGISKEGAACGHANSLTTITNLIKMGNKDAQARFNLPKMREAAIEMTMICTGAMPHPNTELYGARALDVFFPGGGMGGSDDGPNISELMNVKTHNRVSSLADIGMLSAALDECFGPEPGGWPRHVLENMFAAMNRDLLKGVKFDYNCPEGLFMLAKRCGMVMPERALAKLLKACASEDHPTLRAVRSLFAEHNISGKMTKDDFFDVFLGCVISAIDSDVGREFFAVFDLDGSESITASEVEWPLLWALRQFPEECKNLNATLTCMLQRIVVPSLARQQKLDRARRFLCKVLVAGQLSRKAPKRP